MDSEEISYWFLIQIKPNSHKIAEKNLKNQGFEIFYPLYEKTIRKNAFFIKKLYPLFPGYMFVCFNKNFSLWKTINSTIGVSRIVSFGNIPALVPSKLVIELKNRCDTSGKLLISESLEIGNEVELIKGPFTNFVGTIENIDSNQRLSLLLNYMGQNTRLKVEINDIQKIS